MIKSLIKWFGGKYRLLKHILPFPEHTLYVEVFGGSAVVLLNKIKSKSEIYNDINDRLVNFWIVLKNHRKQFKDLSDYSIDSRYVFEKYKEEINDSFTKSVEDAYKFFYINRYSYSGLNNTYHGFSFDLSFNPNTIFKHYFERIDEIYERIKDVYFESCDFRHLLRRTNRKGVLWYLDPPYFVGGSSYEKGVGGSSWSERDFKDLKDLLIKCSGLFTLSIDNKDYFDYSDWFIDEIERVNYTNINSEGKCSISTEYVIRNFDVDKVNKQEKEDIEKSGDFLMI